MNDNTDGFGDTYYMVSRYFVMEGEITGSGNIQYLLTADGSRMDVPDYCYYSMFSRCTSLTQAPELPATTLASNCYNNMFNGCSNMSKDIHMKSTINGTYLTRSHGILITDQNIIYDIL